MYRRALPAVAGSCLGETCPSLSPVASSWAVLQAGEMQKMTMFLPSWFSPKIWCFHDQPPSSKRQQPDLEGVLCPVPTAPNPRWLIGRSKPQWTFIKPCDAAVHKEEMKSSSSRRQTAEAMLDCTCTVLHTAIFRAYFVALAPGSSNVCFLWSLVFPLWGF